MRLELEMGHGSDSIWVVGRPGAPAEMPAYGPVPDIDIDHMPNIDVVNIIQRYNARA